MLSCVLPFFWDNKGLNVQNCKQTNKRKQTIKHPFHSAVGRTLSNDVEKKNNFIYRNSITYKTIITNIYL